MFFVPRENNLFGNNCDGFMIHYPRYLPNVL